MYYIITNFKGIQKAKPIQGGPLTPDTIIALFHTL